MSYGKNPTFDGMGQIVNYPPCPNCGADLSETHIARKLSSALAEIAEAKRQIEARGKWCQGKPPKDGWYWVRSANSLRYMAAFSEAYNWFKTTDGHFDVDKVKWSGPLLAPEE